MRLFSVCHVGEPQHKVLTDFIYAWFSFPLRDFSVCPVRGQRDSRIYVGDFIYPWFSFPMGDFSGVSFLSLQNLRRVFCLRSCRSWTVPKGLGSSLYIVGWRVVTYDTRFLQESSVFITILVVYGDFLSIALEITCHYTFQFCPMKIAILQKIVFVLIFKKNLNRKHSDNLRWREKQPEKKTKIDMRIILPHPHPNSLWVQKLIARLCSCRINVRYQWTVRGRSIVYNETLMIDTDDQTEVDIQFIMRH